MKIVLQKLIAQSGLASRHQAEKFIASGYVKLNGKTAKLGDRADEEDNVTVQGKRLRFTNTHVYIKLHKPAGVISTNKSFPQERNVFDIVKSHKPLSIVGRLDKESEGLLLLTDDGDLAYRLTHPKFNIEKVYRVTLSHDIGKDKAEIKQKVQDVAAGFRKGVDIGLGDGIVKAAHIKYLRGRSFEVILDEGKKRQIRRMFRQLGFHVERLVRVRIGTLTIAGIGRGRWKHLTKEEIKKIKAL